MRSLIVALIIHLTLNILVFLKGWDVLQWRKPLRIPWTVIFAAELAIYCTGFLFYRFLPPGTVHAIRIMGTSWMLFLLYLGGSVLLFDFFYLMFKKQLHRPKELMRQPKKLSFFVFHAFMALVIGILAYGAYRFNHPVTTEVNIHIDKPAGKTDSVRIAMVGDMHLGYMIDRDDARRMVDFILEQQPDLILFVGDILDSHIEPVLQGGMDEELRRLHAPLGIYSCTGNHEYRFEAEEKIKLLDNSGIKMLRDSAVLIDSSFYVAGREDVVYPERLALPEMLIRQKVDRSKPLIVLNHSPYDLSQEANAGADIALYGHTHHGQAFPGNIMTQAVFEVAYGYKKKGSTHIYVTSGLGLVGPQFRVGTVSEVVLLNVKFGRK